MGAHHHAVEAMRPRTGGLSLRQLVLAWNARDNYTDLKNFEMEATNIF